MVLHRSHHRDERRRRVLLEETGLGESEVRGGDLDGAMPSGGNAAKPYSDSALALHQPRVVDLIPVRAWSLVVLVLLVTSAAVGLEALYGTLAVNAGMVALRQVPAFDLAAPGNLASWYAGGLLLLAAGLGCLICLMRRHRTDDYRGRYRMWYWVVPLLMLAGVNQSADWGTSLRIVILAAAGIADYPDATRIWAAMATLLATVVTARLVVEMRASRLAVAFAALSWGSAGFVQAMHLGWIFEGVGTFQVMASGGLRMLACGALFMSLCFYARHVHQEAHGHLPAKRKRKKKAETTPKSRVRRKIAAVDVAAGATQPESAKSESNRSGTTRPTKSAEPAPGAAYAASATTSPVASRLAGAKLRVDASHATSAAAESKISRTSSTAMPPEAAKRRVAALAVAEKSPTTAVLHQGRDESGEGDDGDASLSRSERRRLKKLQRRERRPD